MPPFFIEAAGGVRVEGVDHPGDVDWGVIVLVSTLLVTVYENEILKWIRQRRGLDNVQNTGR